MTQVQEIKKLTAALKEAERRIALLQGEVRAYQAIASQLGRSEGSSLQVTTNDDDYQTRTALFGMSPRMHAALQMIIRGASNREIAERFGTDENSIKVTVYAVLRKLGVSKRGVAAMRAKPVIDNMSHEQYLALATIPKDWDETWPGRKADPHYDRLKAKKRKPNAKTKTKSKKSSRP